MWGQMAKIAVTLVNENLAHARNGEVVLYKRGDSKRWQARLKLKDLKWHRVATKHVNIQYAAETACEAYDRGKVCLQVRYGTRVLELAKGKNSIEVGSGAELLTVLETVKKSVEQGELDTQIEAASAAVRERFIK